jgi:hypothetical protein
MITIYGGQGGFRTCPYDRSKIVGQAFSLTCFARVMSIKNPIKSMITSDDDQGGLKTRPYNRLRAGTFSIDRPTPLQSIFSAEQILITTSLP